MSARSQGWVRSILKDARAIAEDAFINALLVDGKDLRHFKRFSRYVPPEIKVALELGAAPGFDGPVCSDCGNRFRPERDHLEPVVAKGPTSHRNLEWRCNPCHAVKTAADRKAGKLTPRPPPEPPARKGPARKGPGRKGPGRKGPRTSTATRTRAAPNRAVG